MDVKKIGFIMGLAFILTASLGWAVEDYPNKPVQLICPFSVGGITDLSARLIGEKMGEYLGQPVIVVNKPGAGATLGTAFVAASMLGYFKNHCSLRYGSMGTWLRWL